MMYTPQNESELKKDVDFDINHRVADFEAIRLRLDNPAYEKAFMQALEDKYQKPPQIEARSSFFEEIRTISKNSMEFIKRYFERLDAAILSKDKGQSIAPAVYQSIADKQTLRNEIDTWVKNSNQNPAYHEQFTLAQKDSALYFKDDISADEMRRKSQNSLYHTAFEDNLRLQAYSNPQFSLQQAEAYIAKFSIESLRDRSKEQVINPAEKTVNSPEKYGNAKEDLIRWDNQKITPLELGKKLQSPEYKTAFENALHEQYKPGLEGGFGHSFNGSDKEKSAQFVAMRIAGIESAIRVAEKYKEIRANMGKGVNKEPEKAQTRDFER
ncbi:hypothetical protein [Haemophilus sp. 27098_8_127]|uniref:hypothetical protein n=1 Tax=Haemophilus sp. 27098_8_127 TaxID=3003684 RepID=UPI00352C7918